MTRWLTGWRLYWTLGTTIALSSAAFVRFGVPHFPKSIQPWVNIAGITVAVFGLALIPFGSKKRMTEKSSPTSSLPPEG